MPTRLYRLFIPVLIVLIVSLGRQIETIGQSTATNNFLPLVSYSLTGWIGPYGGTIVATAFDPINPLVAYVGTFGSGVFKTLDGGITWFSINQGLTNLQIYSLAVDPVYPSNLYAGTYHSQVFRSTDGGNTWTWSGTGMQNPAIVYSIAIDPVISSTIYASTRGPTNNMNPPYNGILYKSTDAGQTWSVSKENVGGVTIKDWAYSLVVNPNNHQQVFAAFHENGPLRSDDYGATWHTIHTGISDPSGRSIIISPQPEYSSRLYYGVWHFDFIYKTLNSGDLWSRVSGGFSNVKVYNMAIDPFSADVVYVASFSHGVLKTSDAGMNWQPSGLESDQLYSISVNPQHTNELLAGTAGDGLYRSMDFSASWQRSNAGISNANTTALVNSPQNPHLIFSSVYGSGVYQTTDRGQNWQEINNGLADKYVHSLAIDSSNPSLLYALTDSGGLYQNDLNSGNGWVITGQGLPLTSSTPSSFPPDHPFATLEMMESFAYTSTVHSAAPNASAPLLNMVFSPAQPQIAYMGTSLHGAYRSTNGGLSWLQAGLGGQTINGLAVDLADPNLVYAATNIAGSLKVSTNGGISWIQANLSAEFYSVAASPTIAGVAYVGTNTGIYRYQNGSFSLLGLQGLSVTAIALDAGRPGMIFAGTTSGAYYSPDGGVTWNMVDSGLSGQTVTSIGFDKTDPNLVYICTKTHGIYLIAIHI